MQFFDIQNRNVYLNKKILYQFFLTLLGPASPLKTSYV